MISDELRAANSAGAIATGLLALKIPVPLTTVPVSYTHLDVYKRQVIHHVSGGTGLLVPAVAGQGFPVSVGGNRRAGESAVWAADVPD